METPNVNKRYTIDTMGFIRRMISLSYIVLHLTIHKQNK
jgi:hypothetical protein